MFSRRIKNNPALKRLGEISAEFTAKTRFVENVVDTQKKQLRLSFDNGYSFVVEANGKAIVEPF